MFHSLRKRPMVVSIKNGTWFLCDPLTIAWYPWDSSKFRHYKYLLNITTLLRSHTSKQTVVHWNIETGKKFLDDLGHQLNIRSPHEWYRVSLSEIRQYGGSGLYAKYKTLFHMFSTIYPEYLILDHVGLHGEEFHGLNVCFMGCHALEMQRKTFQNYSKKCTGSFVKYIRIFTEISMEHVFHCLDVLCTFGGNELLLWRKRTGYMYSFTFFGHRSEWTISLWYGSNVSYKLIKEVKVKSIGSTFYHGTFKEISVEFHEKSDIDSNAFWCSIWWSMWSCNIFCEFQCPMLENGIHFVMQNQLKIPLEFSIDFASQNVFHFPSKYQKTIA